ncbi:MAG: histidine-type phosphatase [Marinifilaceae bacterium]
MGVYLQILNRLLLLTICLLGSYICPAENGGKSLCQCSANECAGTYMPYKGNAADIATPDIPQGFEPLYICHIGCHGSKNPENSQLIDDLLLQFSEVSKAGKVTAEGKVFIDMLSQLKEQLGGKWGELTPTGVKEITAITQRILTNNNNLFSTSGAHSKIIECASAPSPWCIHSMHVFMSGVKAHTNNTIIKSSYGKENLWTLEFYNQNNNYVRFYTKGSWRGKLNKHKLEKLNPKRFIEQFIDQSVKLSQEAQCNFMLRVFLLRNTILGIDGCPNLDNYFTSDELNDLWQFNNYKDYLSRSSSGEDSFVAMKVAAPLLMEMITSADRALYNRKTIGNFRFAYAETLIPLIALMGIPNGNVLESNPYQLCRYWRNFEIAPMAGNLQWIFFGNKQGEILVKVLLNEKETTLPLESELTPYYDWNKVKRFYSEQLIRILPTIGSN